MSNEGMTNRLPGPGGEPNHKKKTALLSGTGILVTGKRLPHHRAQWQSIRCAIQGLCDTWVSQPNFRLHVISGVGITAAGLWCRLAVSEWLWTAFAIGLVLFAELLNTAVEGLVDLIVGLSPDPLARHIKDVAAACVLTAAALATVIGIFVFAPHLITR